MRPPRRPFLGLVLIPLALLSACSEPEEAAEEAVVVSVRVEPVQRRALQAWVYGQGTARAVQREFLTFADAGRVEWLDPKLRLGSSVARGKLIAYQEPARSRAGLANAEAALITARSEIAQAQAAEREAQATLELARVTLERYRTLIAQNSASQQEFDRAEAEFAQAQAAQARARAQTRSAQARVGSADAEIAQARLVVGDSRIVSPINGVISRLNIEQGRYFTPQTVQTTSEANALRTVPVVVIDPSAFEIRVDLPSYAYRQLAIGSRVMIGAGERPTASATENGNGDAASRSSLPGGPPMPVGDYRIAGTVHAISPALDPESRTFEAIIRTLDRAPQLQDGEFVATWIAQPTRQPALAVPLNALRTRNNRSFVFVVDRQRNIAVEREVRLGVQSEGRQAVLSGLRERDLVVTAGRARLSNGVAVRILGQPQPAAAQRPKR